jgi:hypothetical protein
LSETPALLVTLAACAWTANDPLIKPAIAAPARIVFDFMFLPFVCFLTRARRFPESFEAGADKIDEGRTELPGSISDMSEWERIMSGLFPAPNNAV